MARPTHRLLSLAFLGHLSACFPWAAAAQGLATCWPPVAPTPVADAAVREEYAQEIRAEYLAYFDEAQAFFNCIERVRALVSDDVHQAIESFSTLRSGPPE